MSVPAKRADVTITNKEVISYLKKKHLKKTQVNINAAYAALKNQKEIDALPLGRDISIVDSQAPRQVIYGRCKIGGIITFAAVSDNNQILNLVVTWAGHYISQIAELYLDDCRVNFTSMPGWCWAFEKPDTTIISNENVYHQINLGDDSQLALSTLVAKSIGWTTDHRQRRCAHSYLQLKWDSSLFGDGLPDISALIEGRIIYDPRTATGYYSNNAALVIADYLTNTEFGLGVPTSKVYHAGLEEAADICDETVSLVGGGTEARYTIDGYFDMSDSHEDTLKKMATAIGGRITYSQGLWHILPATWRSPSITLTESDCRGDIRIETSISRRSIINRVRGTFVSKDQRYEVTDYPPVTNSTYLSQDGGEELILDLPLPFTTSVTACQRLAKIELERARQQIQVTAQFSLKAYQLKVGDTVNLTLSRYGWSSKTFEVMDLDLVEINQDNAPVIHVDLTLRETASGVFDWSEEETTFDLSPNSNLPTPFNVSAISDLTLESGTNQLYLRNDGTVFSRLKASWTAITDNFVLSGGHVEIQYKKHSDSDWIALSNLPASLNYTWILDVQDSISYDVRVKAVNALGVASDWTTSSNHTVVGKTAAPSNVSGYTATINDLGVILSWNDISDLDKSFYEIRLGSIWGTATLIAKVKSTSYQLTPQLAGSITYLIKAIDTSGNYSISASSASVTITAPGSVQQPTTQVIETNVLFSWKVPLTGTFPIAHYRIYKGETYATADFIGKTDTTFKGYLEATAGTYTYWIVPVDIAGNVGTEESVQAIVPTPSNFSLSSTNILNLNNADTLTNCFVEESDSSMVLPVVDETFEDHFINNSWSTPQDQIDAGYPIYIQPTNSTATFEQILDLGAIIEGETLVSLEISRTDIEGSLTIVPTISVSDDDVTYTDYTNVLSVYASNFQYVKIRLEVNGGGTAVSRINEIKIVVYLKEIRDQGTGSAVASDTTGTQINFNKSFIAVNKVNITAKHQVGETKGITAVYDLPSGPNPTYFKVLLFSNNTGSRISGTFSWDVAGN